MLTWTLTYSEELLQDAKHFFLQQGRSDFLTKAPLSLCARYAIAKKFSQLGFTSFLPEDGNFQCGPYFFSTSHSQDQIFLALAKQKIAVDLEKIVPRDATLWTGKREEFYMQRCAKECVVKALDLMSREMTDMTVSLPASAPKLSDSRGSINIYYQENLYHVDIQIKEGYVYAVLVLPICNS